MRRRLSNYVYILFVLFLTACGSVQAALKPNHPVESAHPVPGTASTLTPFVRPQSSSSPAAAASSIPPTNMPPATPTASLVSPTSTADLRRTFQICSPLEIHPLEELPEIISDPYRPPPPGKEARHHGVDFSYYRRGERTTIQGVGVQAALAGHTVAAIKDRFPYGNVIIIETRYEVIPDEWTQRLEMTPGESIYTLYAHLDEPPTLSLGDPVKACQLIGAVGKSGNTVEPHLHLEMRLGPAGQSFASMAYYGAKDSSEERENYLRWRTGGEFRHFDPMRVLGRVPPS